MRKRLKALSYSKVQKWRCRMCCKVVYSHISCIIYLCYCFSCSNVSAIIWPPSSLSLSLSPSLSLAPSLPSLPLSFPPRPRTSDVWHCPRKGTQDAGVGHSGTVGGPPCGEPNHFEVDAGRCSSWCSHHSYRYVAPCGLSILALTNYACCRCPAGLA